mmetsp:Transcript_12942/g.24033  ORF Transcript_12942/g.24033 Transcript_12942/m.24033 type:complete len:107 (+) Transcript_12942:463-783(+)
MDNAPPHRQPIAHPNTLTPIAKAGGLQQLIENLMDSYDDLVKDPLDSSLNEDLSLRFGVDGDSVYIGGIVDGRKSGVGLEVTRRYLRFGIFRDGVKHEDLYFPSKT